MHHFADPGLTAPGFSQVLHTSGTTKKPKIVPLTHSNMGNGIQFVARTLELQGSDVCLNVRELLNLPLIAPPPSPIYPPIQPLIRPPIQYPILSNPLPIPHQPSTVGDASVPHPWADCQHRRGCLLAHSSHLLFLHDGEALRRLAQRWRRGGLDETGLN